jgi:hypothetical protein
MPLSLHAPLVAAVLGVLALAAMWEPRHTPSSRPDAPHPDK